MGGQTTPSNIIFIVGVAGDTMLISLCRFICPFSCVRLQGKAMSTVRKGPLADGVWPTMITPFLNDEKKSIDWNGLDIITEWYIKSGVAGIFTVCLSSEMFELSNKERLNITKRVVQKAAGRVPVVAGATFEGTLEEQAELINEMGKVAAAAVIITNQIAKMDDSDEVWIRNAQKLLDLTGDVPLGIYETPVPKCRSLTPEMMIWAAKNGRFVFHKDTSLSVDLMLNKLKAVQSVPGTQLKFFTAKIQFLKALLDNNGNGYSGVDPNFHPWMVVWMCNAGKEMEEKRKEMHRFLSVTDRVLAHKYPTSSKFYLHKFYGVPIRPVSRTTDIELNDQDEIALLQVKDMMEDLCKKMDITPQNP